MTHDEVIEKLRAFLAAEDGDAELREAVDCVLCQARVTARMADRAVRGTARIVVDLEREIEGGEKHHEDPWLLGFVAGSAAMASRCSHAVGHLFNALKLEEAS